MTLVVVVVVVIVPDAIFIGLLELELEQSIFVSSILLQPKNDDFNFLIFSFGLSVGPVFRMVDLLELPIVMSA